MDYQSPGIYVEEEPSGARPIEQVGTATAAFLGSPRQGTTEPKRISKSDEYRAEFGDIQNTGDGFGDSIGLSVREFFQNRGREMLVAGNKSPIAEVERPSCFPVLLNRGLRTRYNNEERPQFGFEN